MSDRLFEDVCNELFNAGKEILVDNKGDLPPAVFILTYRRECIHFPVSFENPANKRLSMQIVASVAKSMAEAAAIVLVTDSWVKKATPTDTISADRPVSSYPDKEEAVTMFVSPKDGPDWGRSQRYTKQDGKIIFQEEEDQTGIENNLLPPNWKTPQQNQSIN